jgi:hypothetical protein
LPPKQIVAEPITAQFCDCESDVTSTLVLLQDVEEPVSVHVVVSPEGPSQLIELSPPEQVVDWPAGPVQRMESPEVSQFHVPPEPAQ